MSSPRARRHRANHQRILDGAMALLIEGGLRSLSMQRLANELDYTAGALYRYFPSKQQLLAELVVCIIDDVGAVVERLSRAEAPPLVLLVAQCRAFGAIQLQAPERFGILTALMGDPRNILEGDEAASPAVAAMVQALQPVAAALAVATGQGALSPGDPAERALVLFAALQGTLQLRKQASRLPDGIDVDHLAAEVVRALLRGWGAPAASLDAVEREAAALLLETDLVL